MDNELIEQMADELTILRTIVHARSMSSGQQHQAPVKTCRHNECVTALTLVEKARQVVKENSNG